MTSTMPGVMASIVTELKAHASLASVQVAPAWPGPATETESIFISEQVEQWTSTVPNIKAGRKHRQETYVLTIEVWVFAPASTPAAAQTIRDRAIALADVVDDVLADDPTIDAEPVQYGTVTDRSLTLVPFEKGWGCQATIAIEVNARLT